MNYWYIERPNELLCDLDDQVGSEKVLRIAQGRLRGAMARERLSVLDFYIYESQSAYHHHLMVRLTGDMPDIMRVGWEKRLADDSNRVAFNLMRLGTCGRSWSLLISHEHHRDYWRNPDYACKCIGKHNGEVMLRCPIAAKLGSEMSLSVDYFGGTIYLHDPIRMGKQ